ncbi:sensor histidine kinase [Ktedonobacter racemifer]|uniref:Integral membrane sensor signal transduction histidine kinase n=1 Tax=Ktedonobacter racemifer DSM 44963 TaxID=485913 RepID=D6TDC1_KTERA|nr:sensor histidine kinase [Ktedonobacter racemifer]EFH88266.1 integral membrane sensor signal transduction histidine kinase [Ktedonobacter racemifer DSM 44963]
MGNTPIHPLIHKEKRLLNWLLFFWLCLTYVQYMLASITELQLPMEARSPASINITILRIVTEDLLRMDSKSAILFPFFVFTLLMVLHGGLHWWALFKNINQCYLWPYFLLQAVCIWLIYFLIGADNAVFGLWLTLAIEAFILLKRTSHIIVVVAGCLLFCFVIQGIVLLTFLSDSKGIPDLAVAPKLIKAIAEGSPILLFVCASLILYIQQTSAHRRDQELLHELETAHIQLEDYAARVKDLTLTTERQRMARELHDTLAQGLVGLTMQLETIDLLLISQRCEQARTFVQRAMTRSRATINSARAAITDLRTEIPMTGDILVAIETEADHFTTATGIPCTCCLQTKFPGEYHEHLLRMVSEVLTNIARHAQASQAWIRVGGENAAITLEIGDNGIGFDPAKVTTGHYGLQGLRERARLMNGQLLISSEPGKGTIVRLCLSLERGGEDGRKAE